MDKLKFRFTDVLKLPQSRRMSEYDDGSLTLLHAEILSRNRFLRKVYARFYQDLMAHFPQTEKKNIIELGSGAGFIKQIYPWIKTSDVLDLPGLDYRCDAANLPFKDKTVDGIVLLNVLHHMKDVEKFFVEANRVLNENGRIVMIEPANTLWARFIYTRFHHELFDPGAGWQIDGSRPLLDANDALAWIIFTRDRDVFRHRFPNLKIEKQYNHTPIAYLLSGGFTLKQLLPAWMYPAVRCVELLVSLFNNQLGMFQTVVLEKQAAGTQ